MPERLRMAVREFVRTMHNPYDLDDLLDRLLSHANAALGCTGAAIMLEDEYDRLAVAAASSEKVTRAERVQSESQTGVCHEAFTTGEVVAVSDLTRTDRWDDGTGRVLELGFFALIGVPLTAWGQTIGVLDLYRDRPTPWSDADVEAAELLAAMGASYILGATRMQAQNQLAEQLHAALASRGTIERAKGIIMQREGVDSDTAFDRLRTTSMNRNQKVRDLAHQIVEHHENRCPTLAPEATASGLDGIPDSTALAAPRGHAVAQTCHPVVASHVTERHRKRGARHDEEPFPPAGDVRDTAAEGVAATARGIA